MTFPAQLQSQTPAKYLFKLVTESETITCNPEPLEWKSGEIEFKRDLEAGGVFSSFHLESLTFVGNGADLLRRLFNASEVNAKCTLIIYYWKEFDLITPSEGRKYIEFPTRFDINFNFYEVVKVGKFTFGIKIKAVNNSTQTKLDNRQDVDVDLNKLVSIGGFQITDYPNLKKELFYPETHVYYRTRMFDSVPETGSGYLLAHVTPLTLPIAFHPFSYTSIPIDILNGENDFKEIKKVSYITRVIDIKNIPSFFENALYDYDSLTVDYKFIAIAKNRSVINIPWFIQILETKKTTSPTGVITEQIVNTFDVEDFGIGLGSHRYDLSGTVTVGVAKGNSLKLVVKCMSIDSSIASLYYSLIKIDQTIATSLDTTTEGFPIFEAIERVSQHILDTQYPIYSTFFGRLDVPYDATGSLYTSENQLRFAHLQSGLNQRGIKLSDNPLAINFKDLFKSIKALYNVGYSIEKNGDDTRIVIERYSDFFDNVELVLDPPISSRISHYDIESSVMPELIPVNIKSGFDNFEYLSLNGRAEPNTTNQRTTIMNTATKFENISKYRCDTKGILDNLANPVTSGDGSQDTKGESDIYIIKTQKGSDLDLPKDWKPEKNENIIIEDDTSLFRDDLMNRYFTPTRMLIRSGNRLKAGMTKEPGSVLKFQKSDKSNNLKTTGLAISEDDDYTITESDDVPMTSLTNPIYKAIKHKINCSFTLADLALIQENQYKYLNFGFDLSGKEITGYLLSLKKKNNDNKVEITIIERYVS